MNVTTWLLVGLAVGAMSTFVIGGIGRGIFADICIGVAGAVLGGWVADELHWTPPFGPIVNDVVVAGCGAVVLLLMFRVFRSAWLPARR